MSTAYLRNTEDDTIVVVEKDSPEYRKYAALKDTEERFPLYEETSADDAGAATGDFITILDANIPAAAAGADADQSVGEAPYAGRVTGVSYTPEANITGDNTESRTYTLVNKGVDGNGATVVATLAMVTGVNGSDFDEKAITLSVVANAVDVVEGAILAFVSTHVGATGLADPGGLVQVQVARGS